jgi:hypothetical protein
VHLDKLKDGILRIIVGIHLMLHRIKVHVESKRKDVPTVPFHYRVVLKNEFLMYAEAKICGP